MESRHVAAYHANEDEQKVHAIEVRSIVAHKVFVDGCLEKGAMNRHAMAIHAKTPRIKSIAYILSLTYSSLLTARANDFTFPAPAQ